MKLGISYEGSDTFKILGTTNKGSEVYLKLDHEEARGFLMGNPVSGKSMVRLDKTAADFHLIAAVQNAEGDIDDMV